MRVAGKLTVWDAQGRFGVIAPDDGSDEVFVEAADGLDGPPPLLGELLVFDVVRNRDGTRRAMNVSRPSRDSADLELDILKPTPATPAPLHRVAPARPARRVRTAWSFGRMLVTAVAVLGMALVLFSHRDKLIALSVEDLDPSKLLPQATADAPAPREQLTN
jgi:cold shock CspA family protein